MQERTGARETRARSFLRPLYLAPATHAGLCVVNVTAKRPFRWMKEDPSTRKIPEGGSS